MPVCRERRWVIELCPRVEGPGRRQHLVPGLKPDKVRLERNSNFFPDSYHLPWKNVSRFQQSGLGVLSKAIALGLVRRSLLLVSPCRRAGIEHPWWREAHARP